MPVILDIGEDVCRSVIGEWRNHGDDNSIGAHFSGLEPPARHRDKSTVVLILHRMYLVNNRGQVPGWCM
jgi:hypothetical protein